MTYKSVIWLYGCLNEMNDVIFHQVSGDTVLAIRNELELNMVVVLFGSQWIHNLEHLPETVNVKGFVSIEEFSQEDEVLIHTVFFAAQMLNKHIEMLQRST